MQPDTSCFDVVLFDLLTLAFTFGFKPLQVGVDLLVPIADNVWFARYAPPAWEFGAAMLVCSPSNVSSE